MAAFRRVYMHNTEIEQHIPKPQLLLFLQVVLELDPAVEDHYYLRLEALWILIQLSYKDDG